MVIIDNNEESLELSVSSIKLDILDDPLKVQEFLKILTTWKEERIYTIVDNIEKP